MGRKDIIRIIGIIILFLALVFGLAYSLFGPEDQQTLAIRGAAVALIGLIALLIWLGVEAKGEQDPAQNTFVPADAPTSPQRRIREIEPIREASPKSWEVVLLLNIFLGGFGAHRFYVGKIGTGIVWLLTGGCFLIGVIADLVRLLCKNFTDAEGRLVLRNSDPKTNVHPSKQQDIALSMERLAAMHASGALTDDEFAAAKAKVIRG